MIISRKEFDSRYKNGELRIAFIGMSNIGKSYRTQHLEETKGFERYTVDDVIAKKLRKGSMQRMVEWMGYPFEPQYSEAEKHYLELENKLTKCRIPEQKNFILDTTGSVVYLEPTALDYLKENYLIINLDCSESMLTPMIEEFFVTPKTIVWAHHFQKKQGEKEIDALRRCYPKLLKDRVNRYRKLADINIPGEISRTDEVAADRFWEIIRYSLQES